MQRTVLTVASACVFLGSAAAPGQAYAATWKETQKGGWERTCHDGGSTACTVWENPTQQVICHGCAETPYKVQPPVPGEPVVKVAQQPQHITVDEMISYQISNLTQKDVEAFAAQFKQFTGTDFTERVVLTLQTWGDAAAVDVTTPSSPCRDQAPPYTAPLYRHMTPSSLSTSCSVVARSAQSVFLCARHGGELAPDDLSAVLGGQVLLRKHAHVVEGRELHDGGDRQRPRQRARPVGMRHGTKSYAKALIFQSSHRFRAVRSRVARGQSRQKFLNRSDASAV
jgi:hypothetical protein